MQKSMRQHEAQGILGWKPLVQARHLLRTDQDVPERQQLRQSPVRDKTAVRLPERKGQHIRSLVPLPVLAIDRAHLVRPQQGHRELNRPVTDDLGIQGGQLALEDAPEGPPCG